MIKLWEVVCTVYDDDHNTVVYEEIIGSFRFHRSATKCLRKSMGDPIREFSGHHPVMAIRRIK